MFIFHSLDTVSACVRFHAKLKHRELCYTKERNYLYLNLKNLVLSSISQFRNDRLYGNNPLTIIYYDIAAPRMPHFLKSVYLQIITTRQSTVLFLSCDWRVTGCSLWSALLILDSLCFLRNST